MNDNNPTPLGEVEMTNDEYHAAPGYSCSHIKTMAGGFLDYYDEYLRPPTEPEEGDEEDEPSVADQWKAQQDLILGSAIHMAVLEPDLVLGQIIEMPGLNFRTKDGRAERDAILRANFPHKLVLSAAMVRTVKRCRDAVYKHPIASKLFTSGRAEQSLFAIDNETGELIKCRPDWENQMIGAVIDVKTCRDSSPDGFARDAYNLRYQFQPPWYWRVMESARGWVPEHWAWVAIEKPTPKRQHARAEVYFQTPDDIEADAPEVGRHFREILRRNAEGDWPSSHTDRGPLPLGRPAWARRREA